MEARTNLPDAPIAQEGFYVTHFFGLKDQEKSKDFYVRMPGRRVIQPENPCYVKLANSEVGQYTQPALDRFKRYAS